MLSTIQKLAKKEVNSALALYQHLHKYPELSFQEFNTSSRIAEELQKIGADVYTGVGGTGVIALIEGEKSGPTIAVRAELDALPIQEQTRLSFASVSPNVMHACGHDLHMANLVATAKVLLQMRHSVKGKVMLVFQPGEELLPGGATLVLESDNFKKNMPDMMMGWHILPELPVGVAGFRSGSYMASGDELYLTVKGKGGHAALPHQLTDTVLIASQIVVALQQVVSRNAPSAIPTVLSIGKIIGNGATNVIPNEVNIEGTFRTMDEKWRAKAHQQIVQLAKGIAHSMGADCEVEVKRGYPALYNNPYLTQNAIKYASQFLGSDKVVELPVRMTTDDFSYYAQKIPSVYFRMGVGNEKLSGGPLHSPTLQIDKAVLNSSIGLTAWMVISLLNSFDNALLS